MMPRHRSSRSQTNSDLEKFHCMIADLFLSFSDPTALMILDIVRKKEMTSRDMSKKLGIKSDTLLAKLRVMERGGILTSCVRAENTLYRVADLHILKAFDRILELPARKLKRTSSPRKELSGATRKDKKSSKTVSVASIR
jgi:DNA-binding transcriptional ArsR family regulator